ELHFLGLDHSLVVFEVLFLVVGLPSRVPSRVSFQDMFYSSKTAPRLDDFVLSTLPSMFPHLVAAFIIACVSMTLPFAMFGTPDLDSILLRIWKIVSGIKSELWFIGGWLPFSLTQSFVVLHRHRRLVCACLVCE
ncbi:hypothetical protein HID58_086178, partial [Brassica napus]